MPADVEYKVRDMCGSDIEAVVALEEDVFPDAWPVESFRESLKVTDGGGLIVESPNGSISSLIGYACYYSAACETHITNFAVSANYRRRGIANKLLDSLFEKAEMSGSAAMILEVRASNESAKKLYESRGFHKLYCRKNYYLDPREDAVVYTRELSDTPKQSGAAKLATGRREMK